MDGQTEGRADRQIDWIDRQTNTQTETQMERETKTHELIYRQANG
jgi:hypothetical protein